MGRKTDKIKRAVLQNSFEAGGLKVPDIATTAKSLKIAWVKRYMSQPQAKWRQLMKPMLNLCEEISIFECNPTPNQVRQKIRNQFWKETVEAWQKIAKSSSLTPGEILNQTLWMNERTNLENNRAMPKRRLIESGVKRVIDLYDTTRQVLLTPNEISLKYGIHPMQSLAIIKSLPQEWKDQLRTGKAKTAEKSLCFSRDA